MIALCLLLLGAGPPSDKPLPDGAVARLGSMHFRADGVIHALAASASGLWLALLDDDGLWLMDARTGRKVREFKPFRPVHDRHHLAFSQDGKWLSVLPQGTIYSVEDGEVALHLELGDKPLASIAFSARGGRVAAGSRRGKGQAALAGVWNLETRRLVRKVAFVQREALVALTPDGRDLAVWGGEMLRIWDVRLDKELVAVNLARFQPEIGAFSPDGKTLALAMSRWDWRGGVIKWYDAATGKDLFEAEFGGSWLAGLEWTPDGRSLFVATADGHAEQFDVKGKRVGQWLPPPGLQYLGLVCTEKNEALALGRHMNSVRVWKVPKGEIVTPDIGHQFPVQAVAFSRDGRKVFTAAVDGCITWAGGKGWPRHLEPLPSKGTKPGVAWAGLSPHGRYFALHERGERLRLFDVAQNRELPPFERGSLVGRQLASAAFPADESAIAVISSEFGRTEKSRAQVFSLPERRLRRTKLIAPEFGGGAIAVSPDGSALAICPASGEGLLYDLVEREERGTFPLPAGPVRACFSPDGLLLAIAGRDGMRLIDARTAKELRRLPFAGSAVAAAISPDGRLLAASITGKEAGVLVWELASGSLRHWLRGQGGVRALAFSPDGGRLATGGVDSTTLIWDMGGRGWTASLERPRPGDVDALGRPDAFGAMARLAGHPKEAVVLLSAVKPVPGIDGKAFRRLVWELRDEDAATCKRSRERLEREGLAIGAKLDAAIKAGGDEETVKILAAIRAKARGWPGVGRMGEHRAVEVLERVGTKAALALLRAWAKGNADAALTVEAKAALSRLERP